MADTTTAHLATAAASAASLHKALGQWSLAKHAAAVTSATSALSKHISAALPPVTPAQLDDLNAALDALYVYAPKAAAALSQEPLFSWHPPRLDDPDGPPATAVAPAARRSSTDAGTGYAAALRNLFSLPAMLERLVLAPLAPAILDALTPAAALDDFAARVDALAPLLRPPHLELPPLSPAATAALDHAGTLLRAMDDHPIPADKLVLLLAACDFVFAALSPVGSDTAAAASRSISADDFLPCLIVAVVASRAASLPLHLQMLHFFLHPSERSSAPGYFLMQACSVVSFISTLELDALHLAPGPPPQPLVDYFAAHPPLAPAAVLPWMSGLAPPRSRANSATAPPLALAQPPATPPPQPSPAKRSSSDLEASRAIARVRERAAREVAEAKDAAASAEAKLATLKAELVAGDASGAMRTNILLREQVDELESTVAGLRAARAIDEDLMAELRTRCDLFCEQIAELEEQAARARAASVAAEAAASAATASVDATAAALAQSRANYTALESVLAQTSAELESLVLEHHALQESAGVTANLSTRLAELEAAAAKEAAAAAAAAAERDDALSELARTSHALAALQDSFGKTREAHSEKLVALELAYAALEAENAELNARVAHAAAAPQPADGDEPLPPQPSTTVDDAAMARAVAKHNYEVQSLKLTIAEAQAEAQAADERVAAFERQVKKEQALNTMLRSELKDALARHAEREDKLDRKVRNAQEAARASLRARNAVEEALEQEKAKVDELSASVGLLMAEVAELETVIQEKEYAELNKEAWIPDADMSTCNLCDVAFSLFKRKHHCRMCGQVLCADCSSNRVALPSHPQPVRACDTCFASRKRAAAQRIRSSSTHSPGGLSRTLPY